MFHTSYISGKGDIKIHKKKSEEMLFTTLLLPFDFIP